MYWYIFIGKIMFGNFHDFDSKKNSEAIIGPPYL